MGWFKKEEPEPELLPTPEPDENWPTLVIGKAYRLTVCVQRTLVVYPHATLRGLTDGIGTARRFVFNITGADRYSSIEIFSLGEFAVEEILELENDQSLS